jgi:drug/metabolite transporter (DMT)-like permease
MSLGMFFNLLMLAILWGSAFPGIKIGLEGLSAAHLTLLRFMVASLCLAVYLLIKKRPFLPEKQDTPFFFLLGLLGITIYHLALNYGQFHVTAGAPPEATLCDRPPVTGGPPTNTGGFPHGGWRAAGLWAWER